MTWLVLGAVALFCWLVGRRWMRIIAVCALVAWAWAWVVVGLPPP